MRNFEIKFLEYKATVFGSGIINRETEKATSEQKALESFLKRKRSTGQTIVIKTIEHVPIKEKIQKEGVTNNGKNFRTFRFASS